MGIQAILTANLLGPAADGEATPVASRPMAALRWLDGNRTRLYRLAACLLLVGTAASLSLRGASIGSTVPPEEAVRGNGYDFTGLVLGRPLSYHPMLTEGKDAVADAIGWTFCGSYNSWTGHLAISGSVSEDMQRQTLLHEYGHAAFEDVAYRSAGGGLAGNAYAWWVATTGRLADRSLGRLLVWTYPPPLRAMYGSYLDERGAYSPEFTNHEANLGEWFAESYARALDGRELPPSAEAVLAGLGG